MVNDAMGPQTSYKSHNDEAPIAAYERLLLEEKEGVRNWEHYRPIKPTTELVVQDGK
jgi:hypothetical protein